jgi:hypothetical protein
MSIEEIRLISDYGIGMLIAYLIIRYIGYRLELIHKCLEELKRELRHG